MLKVARKLRVSAEQAQDIGYVHLFLRGAIALEERAAQLAFHPSDLEIPESTEDEFEPSLYRPVDLRC